MNGHNMRPTHLWKQDGYVELIFFVALTRILLFLPSFFFFRNLSASTYQELGSLENKVEKDFVEAFPTRRVENNLWTGLALGKINTANHHFKPLSTKRVSES